MSTAASRYRYLSEGWSDDGHPHQRDITGFCGSCGATARVPHYRLVKSEVADAERMRSRRRALEIDQEEESS